MLINQNNFLLTYSYTRRDKKNGIINPLVKAYIEACKF